MSPMSVKATAAAAVLLAGAAMNTQGFSTAMTSVLSPRSSSCTPPGMWEAGTSVFSRRRERLGPRETGRVFASVSVDDEEERNGVFLNGVQSAPSVDDDGLRNGLFLSGVQTTPQVLSSSAKSVKLPKGASPKITKISSLEDMLAFLSKDERLCVIKFHASWCKSCQKFGMYYKKLATQEADWVDKSGNVVAGKEGQVRFAEIEFTANAKLCRTLGVKRLPYVHMYRGTDGRLCDFACGPKKFQTVIDKVNEYLGMTKEEVEFNRIMEAGNVLGNEVMANVKLEEMQEDVRERKTSSSS